MAFQGVSKIGVYWAKDKTGAFGAGRCLHPRRLPFDALSAASGTDLLLHLLQKEAHKIRDPEAYGIRVLPLEQKPTDEGAGFAGPLLAHMLHSQGIEVLVLEADASLAARHQGGTGRLF